MNIPADALVLLVGPSACGKTTFAHNAFEDKVISSDFCRYLVSGDESRQDINKQAFDVFHYIIRQRLELGELTVADATNLTSRARRRLYGIAEVSNRPVVNLIFRTDLDAMRVYNSSRDRHTPDHILKRHIDQFDNLLSNDKLLNEKPYFMIDDVNKDLTKICIKSTVNFIQVEDLWIIGDIHGCFQELMSLLTFIPDEATIAFVGDFTDRGPEPQKVLNKVQELIASGKAYACKGNHDWKVFRGKVRESNIKVSPEVKETMDATTKEDWAFVEDLPYQLHFQKLNNPLEVSVVHGALRFGDRNVDTSRMRALALYGETDNTYVNGFPNRTYEWTKDWYGDHVCIFGHTVTKEVSYVGSNCVNIDTGCAFGGKLTAYNPFTMKAAQIEAVHQYASHANLQQE